MDGYDSNQYELRLSHRHVRVLIKALDMFNRIEIGQFERIVDDKFDIPIEVRRLVRGLFDEAKHLMYGLPANASKGICSPELDEDVHISYEIEKVLQKIIAEVEDHHRWSVWRDGPMSISKEPFPTIKQVKDDPEDASDIQM